MHFHRCISMYFTLPNTYSDNLCLSMNCICYGCGLHRKCSWIISALFKRCNYKLSLCPQVNLVSSSTENEDDKEKVWSQQIPLWGECVRGDVKVNIKWPSHNETKVERKAGRERQSRRERIPRSGMHLEVTVQALSTGPALSYIYWRCKGRLVTDRALRWKTSLV